MSELGSSSVEYVHTIGIGCGRIRMEGEFIQHQVRELLID